MYAICFDLDVNHLEQCHPAGNRTSGYDDIRRVMERHGFRGQQGSVYFGGNDPVDCFVVVNELTERYEWFKYVVRDIRMLRVEENNDLTRIVRRQGGLDLGDTGTG